ncbi:unnamed protein product [Spirodela intermedia]|uniref:Uncharacterized protein n=1 Tax=Spirodela intermedia TaxID=51605 RepID=A0A7I8IVE2_SPIIN|nr:unnamed protein product [Spirodela intermedia]CAA6661118.1 unnamed protein product [Spirodela intermedia]
MEASRRSGGGRTNLASCVVAAAFLILVAVVLLVVFFLVFRPKEPRIAVNNFQVPSFAAANGSVRFTFAHTLRLVYGGNQVGFMFIPAGEIDGGRTQYMAATFDVGSFPPGGGVSDESEGKVRVLRFLTHRVEAVSWCQVGVSAGDGSVLGFRC